jgi:hypothetical protein
MIGHKNTPQPNQNKIVSFFQLPQEFDDAVIKPNIAQKVKSKIVFLKLFF